MVKKPSLNIVLPVYNEQLELEGSVEKLADFLKNNLQDFTWQITIADNASTDNTWKIARNLIVKNKQIKAIHLDQKGRGRAVKTAWKEFKTDISAYMDIDLSTDLKHLPNLVRPLIHKYDLAIGTRNAKGSHVYGRSLLRTITSKGYILLIKIFFWVHFSDAQCGFKAVSRKIVDKVVPLVRDNAWFFDTELLLLSEKMGYLIYEEPVTWIDNPGSTVRVLKTAQGDLKGLWRLFIGRPWRHYGHN